MTNLSCFYLLLLEIVINLTKHILNIYNNVIETFGLIINKYLNSK